MSTKAGLAGLSGLALLLGWSVAGAPDRALADGDPTHPAVSGLTAEITREAGYSVYDVVALNWSRLSTSTAPMFAGITVRGSTGTSAPQTESAGFAVYSGKDLSVSTLQIHTPESGGIVTYTVFADYSDHPPVPASTSPLDGASVTFAPSPPTITYGDAVLLTGRVLDAMHGTAISGANLTLSCILAPNSPPLFQLYLTTDANGNFSRSLRPTQGYTYTLFYPGDQQHIAGTVGPIAVHVRPQVAITPGLGKPKHNKSFQIRVSVGPAHTGHPVHLQRRSGGKWQTVQIISTDSHGAVTFKVKEKRKGTYSYRADAVADPLYSEATSKQLTVKVR